MTAIAIGARTSAPAPLASASGRKPNRVLRVVMMIGRRRERAPSTSASRLATPASRSWLTLSTRMIAFLVTSPTSRISPMNTTTEMVLPVSISASTAPTSASGMVNRITNGCSSDSNCEAITR